MVLAQTTVGNEKAASLEAQGNWAKHWRLSVQRVPPAGPDSAGNAVRETPSPRRPLAERAAEGDFSL